MNKQIIPIFFTIDDNFAPYLSVAIKSMLDNANKDYFYNVHIVHEGLSNENKNKLKVTLNCFKNFFIILPFCPPAFFLFTFLLRTCLFKATRNIIIFQGFFLLYNKNIPNIKYLEYFS